MEKHRTGKFSLTLVEGDRGGARFQRGGIRETNKSKIDCGTKDVNSEGGEKRGRKKGVFLLRKSGQHTLKKIRRKKE